MNVFTALKPNRTRALPFSLSRFFHSFPYLFRARVIQIVRDLSEEIASLQAQLASLTAQHESLTKEREELRAEQAEIELQLNTSLADASHAHQVRGVRLRKET